MKATEFVKQHGLDAVNKILQDFPKMTHVSDDAGVFLNDIEYKKHAPWFADSVAKMVSFSDLKRIIESHELVNRFHGLGKAKRELQLIEEGSIFRCCIAITAESLKQAIADVEACQ